MVKIQIVKEECEIKKKQCLSNFIYDYFEISFFYKFILFYKNYK